ncbi:fibronectin type III domain-containing protein [Ancylothrix sp. D3o]|uniref:fibronectin type III domain-containing protein n=1 Tax=Ancylothrix sp. D3o TaxID=2953691 RepID=UPI0021BAD8C1|nr:fibronectin type III domain-containing protein [Ancylothrix sp. D3o]
MRVIPTKLEILDEEVKLQGELDNFFLTSYSYARRKEELQTLQGVLDKLSSILGTFSDLTPTENQVLATVIPGFGLGLGSELKKLGYTIVNSAIRKVLNTERSKQILRAPASNELTVDGNRKPVEISVTSKGLNVPQVEIPVGKITLPSYAQFNGSNSYFGISPFFSLPVELENATAKTEKNSAGQDVLILKGKGTNLNLSDILPSFPGSAEASKFFKVSYDFSEPESYISIAPGETRYVGRFSAEGAIIPKVISIRKASTLIDSTKNTYDILGEVGLPWAKDYILGARLRVVEGKFDAIALKADNLNIALGSSGVFLQRIEGGVSNLARGGFPTLFAGTGMTFGKSFDVKSINIPYIGSIVQKAAGAIANSEGQIYMARADADVGIDASRFGGKANVKVLGGIFQPNQARFSYNYKNSEALFDVSTATLLGIATIRGSGMVNSDRIFLAGSAALKIPDAVPKIGGRTVAGGYALLNFTNDGNYSNDYIAAWANYRLLNIGGKFRFDGKFELLTGNNINPISAEKDNQVRFIDEKLKEELNQAVPSPFKSSRVPLARTVVEESLPEAPAPEAPDDPALAGFAEGAVFENAIVESSNPLDTAEETEQIDEEVEEISGSSTDDPLTEEPDAELVPSDETEPTQEDEDEAELYDIEAGNSSEVTYGVTGGKYFMFTVSWENSAPLGSVPFEVIGPDGTVYSSETIPIAKSEAEYEQPWKVGIIGEFSDDKQLTILVKEPEIGEWTLSMTDTDTLGALEYGGSLDAPDPTIRFNSIDFDPTTSNVNINYQAADPDSEATITFFYDTDGTGKNGTPISDELVESDGQGNFSWNATDLPSGEYYIYAMLQDDDNAPRFVYAPNPVTVIEPGSLSRVTDVGASSVGEDTVLVSWQPVEGAAYYIVDYDTNAAGSEVERIEDSTMVVYDDNAAISGLKAGETYRFTVTAVDEQDDHSLPSLAAIAKVGGGSVEDMAPDADEWSVYATPGTTYTEAIPVPFEGSVTLLEAPRGVALNPTTGEFTWNVPTDAYGWYNVRVLQTDNSNETSVYDFDLFAGTPPEAEGDVEIGSTAADNLTGNADDDLLASGAGDDESAGGDGDDEMYGNGGDDQLLGEAGGDDMQGGQGNDAAFGGADDDIVDGDKGDDKLYGNVGEDELMGGEGSDEIYCGQDDDMAFGNEGSDQMSGDLGNDMLAGGKNNDVLNGGAGEDEMYGGMDEDSISGGIGDDIANGNVGNDFIDGGDDSDELSGGQGNDTLAGGAGDDNLYGDKGNDNLAGGDGNNFLQGANEITGPEIDTLTGGTGEDYFSLGEGAEPLYSAFGNDDYVLIQNFEFDKDSLLLPGNPDSYLLIDITAESNLPSGIGIGYVNSKGQEDLVAILAGVTDTNAFTDNSFTFLNSPPEPATT